MNTLKDYRKRTIELETKGTNRTENETYELEKLFWNYPCNAKIPISNETQLLFTNRFNNGIGYATDKNRSN
jgi:hypothetical protein